MADALLALLLTLATLTAGAAVVYAVARDAGRGRCLDCGRMCAPWSVYCWRHIETRDVD